ncbi:MAG: PEP-CTERM sorting domain-containing protein [Acidobacteria bacterium]|nr:PEP-CTERM sorting domain-containing protein [Acidobacteriota bacterium]
MRSLVLGGLLLGLTASSYAVSFKNVANGVWNTGLNNAAALLTAPSADSHYVLVPPAGCTVPSPPASCSGFGPNAVLVVGPPSNGTWPGGNGAESQWIGPVEQQGAVGNNGIYNSSLDYYVYRMIFNLNLLGLDALTANISLRWTADNNVNSTGNPTQSSHIRVCSIPDPSNRNVCDVSKMVASSQPGAENTNPFTNAPIVNIGSSAFAAGLLAMDFVVYNSPIAFGENPTGLRVEFLSANADPAPEPMTMAMMGLGLLGIGLWSRRK